MAELTFVGGLLILLVGLGLAFLGRRIIKILVFCGGGIAGASLAYALLNGQDQPIPLIAALVGFFVLGFLSIVILKFIFGAMVGIAAFFIANAITGNILMAILIGILIFILGWFLFKYYLSLATAFAGGVLVFAGLQSIGVPDVIALIIGVVIGIAGVYYQVKQIHD
jgi:hypothetical protein